MHTASHPHPARRALVLACLAVSISNVSAQTDLQTNLFNWRGPFQTGVSPETYTDWAFEGEKALAWTAPISGRGCPLVVDGNLYVFGYNGEATGADQQIILASFDALTGAPIWENRFNDFLSDTIYSRYGTGSPVVDVETRNLYLLNSTGLLSCFDKAGTLRWQHSLMESFGRLTFPNGRTGAPVIEGDLVIVRGITSFWGSQGPARDRFYAFEKHTGAPVWSAEPGTPPKDSSFSTPLFETRDGKRVFYVGTGCGNVVCINARTGQTLWRFPFCDGGVNSSLSLHPATDTLICVHGQENLDTSQEGRMIALKLPKTLIGPGDETVVLANDSESWRNAVNVFTSSPTVVGDRCYALDKTGNLVCVNLTNGEVVWSEKLAADNLHSSATYADGILYVPTNPGTFFVIRPTEQRPERLAEIQLEGNCLGAPAIWQGHVYVLTTAKLYAFKMTQSKIGYLPVDTPAISPMKEPSGLMVIPNEIVLSAGESAEVRVFQVDATGVRGNEVEAALEPFVPPTALVKATLDGRFEGQRLVTEADAEESAGMFKATAGGLSGFVRTRVVSAVPYQENFESYELTVPHPTDGVNFAYPALPWIGGRLKWEVRDLEGNKVLVKTLDNVLFQRAMTFIGKEKMSGYTLEADVMTDGNRRIKGDIGLINQRYLISLKGNANQLEISSNHERIKTAVPFPVKPRTWYRIKTRVDLQSDGSGVVRGKAWEKGAPEPEAWTIEFHHRQTNTHGAPGLFGFAPQSQKHVYIDEISLTASE